MSAAQISGLFVLWSTVGIVAEVPSGALADRFSRRKAMVAAGLLQACGYVLWTAVPGYRGFAAGFVLWGIGGACASGAMEALLYDGLAVVGAEERYARIYGRVNAMGLVSQLPAAAAAIILFSNGGYVLVGWASVACCLGAAAVAARLPEARPPPTPARVTENGVAENGLDEDGVDEGGPSYFATLRAGVAEAARRPAVRAAAVALALLGGVDGLEEYIPLLAEDWGVATATIPLALVGIPLVGAAGAALGGRAGDLRPRALTALLGVGLAVFGAVAILRRPVGVAGIAIAYGLYQVVLVVVDARLQQRIEGRSRATVTSVASLGVELMAIVLFGASALGQPAVVAAVLVAMVAAFPWLLRTRP